MTASEMEDLAALTSLRLREALDELTPAYQLATAEIMTTLTTIFESGKATHSKFLYFDRIGSEKVIRILNSDTWRLMAFGFLRGEYFGRGSLKDSRRLLAELPDMIHNRQKLALKLRSVRTAYRAAVEREERQFFIDRAREREETGQELSREEFLSRQLSGRKRD